MVNMDVALKIVTGVLVRLQVDGQVSCAQEYSNMVCIVLLRYNFFNWRCNQLISQKASRSVRGYINSEKVTNPE